MLHQRFTLRAVTQVLWSAAQWKGQDVVEYGQQVLGFPGRVVRHPMLARLQHPRTAVLIDGTELQNVDAVIYCTGYKYSLSFLDDEPDIVFTDGQRCVDRLYNRPSLHIACTPLVVPTCTPTHHTVPTPCTPTHQAVTYSFTPPTMPG